MTNLLRVEHVDDRTACGRIHLGTSGWVYTHWRRLFYPEKLPGAKWLDWYARHFATVELNNTFYRLPSPEAVACWRDTTPAHFHFAVKGSRFLTHMKKLKDVGQGLDRFFERANLLGAKMGPVLWQLPPQMREPDLPRLATFLEALPRHTRYVLEFRSDAWHVEEVCDLLDRHGVAICEHDNVRRRIPRPTGGFRYVRFHGTSAQAGSGGYGGLYGERALRPAARSLQAWADEGRDAWVYFNNDLHGHALRDAFDLARLLRPERVDANPGLFQAPPPA